MHTQKTVNRQIHRQTNKILNKPKITKRQTNLVDVYLVRLKSEMIPSEKAEVYSREEEALVSLMPMGALSASLVAGNLLNRNQSILILFKFSFFLCKESITSKTFCNISVNINSSRFYF